MSKTKTKHIVIDARIRRSAGVGRYVDRLLEHLQTLDTSNKYSVLIAPDDPWKPASRRFTPVVSRYKQFSFNPWQQLAFSWQLYRLKPNLVHFTMTGQQPLFYFGRQVTFTHDLTMLRYTRRGRLPKWAHKLRMQAYRLILWQSHHIAKKILVPSEFVRDDVLKYHLFTSRKLVVTLEASEPPLNGKAAEPELAKDGKVVPKNFLLYVGSAFPHKNLRRLVTSFEAILEKQPDLKLVFVGKQEYHSKKLQRWVNKKSYAEHVIFTGFVPDAELKWFYENAAVYVFPSLSEGFGLPGLEAMVHGCPVASSNATCLPEIYGEAAHYFDPLDTEDITKAVLKVLRSEELRKTLVDNGYPQAKQFSWKRMSEQTLAIYDETTE